jgi:ABC-2 type transport system permease protein
MSTGISHVAGSKRTTAQIGRELWATRKILGVLIRRDLKLRYANSALGWVWTVLEPLMMASIYWFVFTLIFHRSVGEEPYIIFLLAGLLPWFWFTNGLTKGSEALMDQRKLIRSTALPRQIWVLRSVGAKGSEFLLSIPVFVLFLLIYRPTFDSEMILIPLGIVLELILLTGLGLLLAPIMLLLRDVQPLVRIATRAMFYASPVIYGFQDVMTAERIPQIFKYVYMINPLSGLMECYRSGFFPYQANYQAIGISAAVSVFTLVVGWFVFKRLESRMLKEI